jgi:hypothetical protein
MLLSGATSTTARTPAARGNYHPHPNRDDDRDRKCHVHGPVGNPAANAEQYRVADDADYSHHAHNANYSHDAHNADYPHQAAASNDNAPSGDDRARPDAWPLGTPREEPAVDTAAHQHARDDDQGEPYT